MSYSVSTDRYWECAGQPLASFSLSLVTFPEVFAKVNSTQFLLIRNDNSYCNTALQHCFEWLQYCSNISILCHMQIILCNITLSGECWQRFLLLEDPTRLDWARVNVARLRTSPGPPGWGFGVGPITPHCVTTTDSGNRPCLVSHFGKWNHDDDVILNNIITFISSQTH